MQQHTALEVPARGPRSPGAFRDPNRVTLKALERPLGKNDAGTLDRGHRVKLNPDPMVLVLMQGDDLPPEHIVFSHRRAQVLQQHGHRALPG
jgi:hypothetical protein